MTVKIFTIDQFKKWGKQGGSKQGKSKVRGNSEYYRQLRLKRVKKKPEDSGS